MRNNLKRYYYWQLHLPGNEWPDRSLATRLNTNLAIMFARLQIQYGAGNCKKGYFLKGEYIKCLVSLYSLDFEAW